LSGPPQPPHVKRRRWLREGQTSKLVEEVVDVPGKRRDPRAIEAILRQRNHKPSRDGRKLDPLRGKDADFVRCNRGDLYVVPDEANKLLLESRPGNIAIKRDQARIAAMLAFGRNRTSDDGVVREVV